MKKRNRKPIIGIAFDQHQRNTAENVQAYIDELEYYGRRRFGALIKEGRDILDSIARDDIDSSQSAFEWMTDCDSALTEWARNASKNDYLVFGPFEHNGGVGFYVDAESFLEFDCDLRVDDTGEVPRGFSGLVAQISDHGNITAYRYVRGRAYEIFSVV